MVVFSQLHLHRTVKKFLKLRVFFYRSEISLITLHSMTKIVVLVIDGKCHPSNPLDRYLVEVRKGC